MKVSLPLVGLLSLFFLNNAYSQTSEFNGIVSKVSDGDTIHVLYEGEALKIRLSHIDAPERKQAHGIKSQKFLEEMILDKSVTVACKMKDGKWDKGFYGRLICNIFIYEDNSPTYINAKMIKSGNAWVYKRERNNDYLLNLERDAKENRRGLWSIASPIEPWIYRKLNK
jgi:endonuclease YncB( thermonuclease family)|tara:strand:- start:158 stop:664 length:507 start_codon:yes stop_codon:yes gene_type:complete